MSIGMTEDHRSLYTAMRDWGHSIDGPELIRVAEADGGSADAWSSVIGQGLTTIAVPESLGGGGGSRLDLAVTLEAAAHEYFKSSEQIPTRVRLAVGEEMSRGSGHRWRAGGILLQFLPKAPDRARVADLPPGDATHDFDVPAKAAPKKPKGSDI